MDKSQFSEDQLSRISEAIIGGNKIEAIKVYRDITGYGLKEAKEAVEALTRSLAAEHPEILENPSSSSSSSSSSSCGCIAFLLVIGILLVVISIVRLA